MGLSRTDWQRVRQSAAKQLEGFNRKACIHFAEVLRKNDEYERICRELNVKPERLIPKEYFEIVYRVLSHGKYQDRAKLMLGSAESIEKLVSGIQKAGGFYDERDFWIEV